MPFTTLRVLSDKEAAAFVEDDTLSIDGDQDHTPLHGSGDLQLLCGNCGRRVAANMPADYTERLRTAVVRCPRCKRINQLSRPVN